MKYVEVKLDLNCEPKILICWFCVKVEFIFNDYCWPIEFEYAIECWTKNVKSYELLTE